MVKKSTAYFLFKQGIREIFSLWKQFIAIIAIGAIAVTLFVGLQANADSLRNRVDAMYAMGNVADTYVTVNPMKGNQGDLTEIKSIVDGKGEAEGRFYAFTKLNTYNAYCAISPTLPTISKASEMNSGPSQTNEDFFIVDSILSSSNDEAGFDGRVAIGQPATIEFDLSPYAKNGLVDSDFIAEEDLIPFLKEGVTIDKTPVKTLKINLSIPVTGLMSHPENVLKASYSVSVYLLSSSMFAKAFDEYLSSYFTEEGIDIFYGALALSPIGWERERPARFPIPDQFLIKYNNGSYEEPATKQIREYFDKKTDEDSNLISIQNNEDTSFASVMETDVIQARQLTFVFPFVFFAVAILVILTTMSQLILKERVQIGTLKALGFSSSMVRRYYSAITLGVTGIGILIGEILGPLIIPMIMDNKYSILYNLPKGGYLFPVLSGVLTAAVFMGLAALVTFLTCRKEASLPPCESMRPSVQKYSKKTVRNEKISKNCTVFSLLMAIRNILHNKVKSLMVIFGVMGCTALLCCGFGIDDTINKGLHTDPFIRNSADVTLTLTGEVNREKIAEDLKNLCPDELKGIEGYTRSNTDVLFNDHSVSTYYQVMDSYYSLDGNEGKTNFPAYWDKDQVLLTKKIADRLNVHVGDTIRFSIGSISLEAKVFSIDDFFYSNGVFIHTSSSLLKNNPIDSFASYYVNVREGVDPSSIKENISSKLSYVGSIDTSEDWLIKLQDVVSSISAMTMAVKVFAILLAIVVLVNLALLNFKERGRDIATMKVLGFSRMEIALSLFFETMFLTSVGVLLGLALGFPFLYLVLFINQVEVVSFPYMVAVSSYFIAFALTFGVAAIINLYLGSRTNKIKMVESLKSVE